MSNLGSRIRRLRLSQQRTLSDVAKPCGFTVSLLSKIESAKISPPIATLSKIAFALGTSLGALLEEKQVSTTVLSLAKTRAKSGMTRTDKGYGFHLLAPDRVDKIMQPFIFVAEKGKVKQGTMAHCGEEFIYVLAGQMRYRVGDTTYTLGEGDSLYFSAEEEHDLEPITASVRYIGIFTERTVPKKQPPAPAMRRKKD